MAKTKFEEMFDRLPANIKETSVLRNSSKKVLAALLELLLHSEAKKSGIIFCGNSLLRKLSGINKDKLRPAIDQLIDYDLISRKVGKARKEGEKGLASEYIINFKKLKEPLIEKTFDDLFGDYIDNESSETPINTTITITNTISNTNSISTPISNTISTLISNSMSTSTENTTPIENTNTTLIQNQEQVQEKPGRPTSQKELMDYFKDRMEKECKDKNLDELNEIQEFLKNELDSFNEIRGYKDVYSHFIVPSMNKKREKLQDKEFERFITGI
jgi:hypothetical protein